MAVLQLADGTIYREWSAIARELASLQIAIARLPVSLDPDLQELLDRDILSLTEKQQILQVMKPEFEALKQAEGYQWRDLVVLHPGSPHLYPLYILSDRCHIHSDEEVLHILAGECVFGFLRSDNTPVHLLLETEEYIKIPAGTQHWFYLTASLHLKAVRYYTTVEGWVPQYPVQS